MPIAISLALLGVGGDSLLLLLSQEGALRGQDGLPLGGGHSVQGRQVEDSLPGASRIPFEAVRPPQEGHRASNSHRGQGRPEKKDR